MKNKNNTILKRIFIIMLIACISLIVTEKKYLYSKFVLVEDDDIKKDKKEKKKESPKIKTSKNKTLPINIAYNIKVIKVQGKADSIKISWDTNPKFVDEYFVGRSNEEIGY